MEPLKQRFDTIPRFFAAAPAHGLGLSTGPASTVPPATSSLYGPVMLAGAWFSGLGSLLPDTAGGHGAPTHPAAPHPTLTLERLERSALGEKQPRAASLGANFSMASPPGEDTHIEIELSWEAR